MNLTLVVPCAGKSTRFNSTKPKPLLTHPNGNLMLIEAINGLDVSNVTRLVISLIKEHVDNTKINLQKVKERIYELKGIVPEFIILPEFTSSQSDTIYQTIKMGNITGAIFIKDCDNYFNVKITDHNAVCVSSLTSKINAINKSYVSLDKLGNLSGIVEKSVISNRFCVGGYSFSSAESFVDNFEKIKSIKGTDSSEIYISHVIQQMLLDSEIFEISEVTDYNDWGTIEDWLAYTKEFKTIFIDLDGVLVINSSEYFDPEWGSSEKIKENVDFINSLYFSNKVRIIITTARKEKYKEKTIKQLKDIGLNYHQIIFDLPHAERIVINDFSSTNPYPSATAICIKRNDSNLKDFFKG